MLYDVNSQPFYAATSEDNESIYPAAGAIVQPESEAIEEVSIFLNTVAKQYDSSGLPQRADSVRSFMDGIYVVDKDMLATAVEAFTDELVDLAQSASRVTILHSSAEDKKDQSVGSSEFIIGAIVEKLKERDIKIGRDVYVEDAGALHERGVTSDEKVMFYDDWMITGGQVRKMWEATPVPDRNLAMRFVALRENWSELLAEPLKLQGDLEYFYEAGSIDNIAEGPSVVGTHSSANIGWQNRIAVFGLDLSYLREREVPLPALGSISRPYRTRVDEPYFYKHPQVEDLVAYRHRNGQELDGFSELCLESLTHHFRRDRFAD